MIFCFNFLYFLAIWSVIAAYWRLTTASHKNAASLTSLTYCFATVCWTVYLLTSYGRIPSNAFDNFELQHSSLSETESNSHYAEKFSVAHPDTWYIVLSFESFLMFSVAYFSTDMLFDYDPRFVTHHVLSLLAMVTTWMFPNLQGAFTCTALIAEVGGVMFHVSKLIQRNWMTLTFLYVYSFTRVICFPLFLGWLISSLLTQPTVHNIWATTGTAGLIGINVNWCRKQWMRYLRDIGAKAKTTSSVAVTATPTEVAQPQQQQQQLQQQQQQQHNFMPKIDTLETQKRDVLGVVFEEDEAHPSQAYSARPLQFELDFDSDSDSDSDDGNFDSSIDTNSDADSDSDSGSDYDSEDDDESDSLNSNSYGFSFSRSMPNLSVFSKAGGSPVKRTSRFNASMSSKPAPGPGAAVPRCLSPLCAKHGLRNRRLGFPDVANTSSGPGLRSQLIRSSSNAAALIWDVLS
jgi:TLC domain